MRACVTGGTGFIGEKLVADLLAGGHHVAILTRKKQNKKPQGVKYIQADLTVDSDFLVSFLEGCDVLFNCAGEVKIQEKMRSLHVDGTKRLIAAAQKVKSVSGKKIHWVQLSSVGAYGPDQRATKSSVRIVYETTPISPVGEYEATKTKADEIIIEAGERGIISYSILRPSNVFGKRMPNSSIRSIVSIIKKGWFFYIGRNDAIATYIHVDDVVDCLIACGTNEKAKGQVFNISNDCSQESFINSIAIYAKVFKPRIRLPEFLVRIVVKALGKIIPLPLNNDRINALRAKTTYPSDKIGRLLGARPKRNVTVYIREVVEEVWDEGAANIDSV